MRLVINLAGVDEVLEAAKDIWGCVRKLDDKLNLAVGAVLREPFAIVGRLGAEEGFL